MKPEESERLLVEHFYRHSVERNKIDDNYRNLDVSKLAGDASTRRYYRLETNSNSYVICLDQPRKGKPEDYPFYNVHACLNGADIRVPAIYDIDITKGYLLEEDLGDQPLLSYLARIKDWHGEFEIYRKCIDILMKMQKMPSQQIAKYKLDQLQFDREKFMYEFRFTIDFFLEKLLGHKLSKGERQIIFESFENISQELASYPMVLTHRDFHSRNIMLKKNELILIDFQDARLGIPQYDLVSLLEDCYYSVKRTNKIKLLEYYRKNMELPGQKDEETFMRLYRLMTIQRVFKAIGSFAYIFHNRKDKRYLRHIGFAMENVRRKLMYFPEYTDLREALLAIYYEH